MVRAALLMYNFTSHKIKSGAICIAGLFILMKMAPQPL